MHSILLCLATKKGFEVLEESIRRREDRPLHVCTFEEKSVAESYHSAIAERAASAHIPVCSWQEFRSAPEAFLDARGIAAVVCIGWRYLVPAAAVRHLRGEVLVAHDSLLPRLRGFAPLPTALITGERETGVTFLRAGPGLDDGEILWQEAVEIGNEDTIAALIDKVIPLYREGIRLYLAGQLRDGKPQDESQATYSIWRDDIDYRIDWGASAEQIERTVRALGPPYLGARCRLDGREAVLQRVGVEPDLHFAIRQPGKIWSLDAEGRPIVVCGAGLVKILEASAENRSILPVKSLRQRCG